MFRYRLLFKEHKGWVIAIGSCFGVLLVGSILWSRLSVPPVIDSFESCVVAGYPPSDSDPQTCSNGYQTFVGPGATSAETASTATETEQPYQILVEGNSEGTYPAAEQIITTQAAWASYWAQVNARVVPMPPLLPVDFTREEVIAITVGAKPTNDYALELTGILVDSAKTTVSYEELVPTKACRVTSTPTDYYLLVETAKTVGSVSFDKVTEARNC